MKPWYRVSPAGLKCWEESWNKGNPWVTNFPFVRSLGDRKKWRRERGTRFSHLKKNVIFRGKSKPHWKHIIIIMLKKLLFKHYAVDSCTLTRCAGEDSFCVPQYWHYPGEEILVIWSGKIRHSPLFLLISLRSMTQQQPGTNMFQRFV